MEDRNKLNEEQLNEIIAGTDDVGKGSNFSNVKKSRTIMDGVLK